MRLLKNHLRREGQGAKVRGQESINIYGGGGGSKGDQGTGQLGECKVGEVKRVEMLEVNGHRGECSEEVLKDKGHLTSQDGSRSFKGVVGMDANCEGLRTE